MPKLTITFGGEVQGERSVEEPITVVGRDAACQVRIDNLGISRTHCRITKQGGGYVLQDMDSANGTFVNGSRITEHSLSEGDEILVGKYTLKFSLAGAEAPAPKTPTDMIDMGDAMHTYVMDGEKIRERLGQIRAAGGPEAEAAAAAEATATAVPDSQPAATPPPGAQLPPAPGPGSPTTIPAPMPSAGPAVPAPPVPRRAMDHALDFDPLKPQTPVRARSSGPTQRLTKPASGGAAGLLLYMSLGTNLVLIVLLGVLIVFLWKMMQQQKPTAPAPQPPAATSPAPTPAPAAAPEVEPAEPGPGVPSE
jgi:predicted component of type VI protein secretion system